MNRRTRIIIWIGIWGVLLEVQVAAVIWGLQHPSISPLPVSNIAEQSVPTAEVPVPEAISTYTGLPITKKQAEQRALGVMIAGDPVTRPQSGLGVADVVVEMEAAVGITRFMAVMQSEYAKEIGSIRSARNDFIDLAEGLDAVFVHWGGEKRALDRLAVTDVAEIDQFANDDLFYRILTIPGPHNGFTSDELMRKGVSRYKYSRAPKFSAWKFEQAPIGPAVTLEEAWERAMMRPGAGTLKLAYGNPQFDVEYRYDGARNVYSRKQGGEAHKDAVTKKQIEASNVVVVRANYFTYDGVGGYLQFDFSKGGDCTLYKNGRAIPCKWKKGKETAPLNFFDKKTGEQLELAPGKTWIQVMSPSAKVSWKNE